MSQRSLIAIIVTALLVLATGIYFGTQTQGRPKPEAALSPEAVSRFFATRLNDEKGQLQRIDQWRGRILVVNFWAAWCQPCREEMPAFNRLQAKYAANGVQFVGIALDSAANVATFRKLLPINYPVLIAEEEGSELTRQLGNHRIALPYTVIFGKNGAVRLTKLGRMEEQELDALLNSISAP
ncbi:MAG: TlpA disulfide reductase family protein [Betaproteobacteria bacterium]